MSQETLTGKVYLFLRPIPDNKDQNSVVYNDEDSSEGRWREMFFIELQGGRKTVTILTPPLSLAWVDRSGSYFRCFK